MTHTALARKYRPTRFSDLVAQEHVAAGLAGAVAKGRVAHAYLLTGPRGVGKTSAARILAMALNCQERETAGSPGEPCGRCNSCVRIWSGAANLDVVEIDAASNRGVDDARELRERAMYAASNPEGFKVYIVDEAHMLTREAWNALLKILEEPPPRVVFVFATTEPQKIANTAAPVMSRVQRFDFRRIGPHAIVERLRHVIQQESISCDEEALHLIGRVADGGMRDGLSLLDQALAFGEGAVTAARVRQALGLIDDEMYAELLGIIAGRRAREVFPFVARLIEAGADLVEFVNGAGEMLRALLVHSLGGEVEGLTTELRSAVERQAGTLRPGDLLRMLRLLGTAETTIRRSPNARLHVETLLVQWTLLDRTVELADVIQAVSGGGAPEPASSSRGAGRDPEPAAPVAPPAPSSRQVVAGGIDAVRAAWPQVLEAVGQRRRMVREALAHATPVALQDNVLVLEVTESEVHLEGLERSRDVIQKAVSRVAGVDVQRIEYRADAGDREAAPPLKRLDRSADQEERLRRYRQADPGLDVIAEALDLEVIE